MTKVARLVSFGRGGDSVDYGKGCSCSGYGNPDNPHAADPASCEIPDGTPAIDKRPALETPEGFAWVFKGPMCNVDIEDGGVDECPQPSPIMAQAMADNPYGGMLAMQESHREQSTAPGPLDHVSISEYVEGWRRHGARIGRYQGGQIVWEK